MVTLLQASPRPVPAHSPRGPWEVGPGSHLLIAGTTHTHTSLLLPQPGVGLGGPSSAAPSLRGRSSCPEPDAHIPVCTQTGQPPRVLGQALGQQTPAPSTPGPPRGEEGPIRYSLAAAPRPGFREHPAKGLPKPLAAASQPLAGGRSDRGSGKGALGGVDKVSQASPAAWGRADAGQGST